MDKDQRILLAHKVFQSEKAIYQAIRDVNAAKENLEKTKRKYYEDVAVALKCKVSDLQFSDSICCFGTKLISHCVWDLRPPNSRWPLCVFCGSPRDGD